MSTIVTRAGKGSPLTHNEVDANFNNLNTDKLEYTSEPTRHSVRPSLLLDFANTKTLDPRITFTRASTGTFYDGKTVAKAEENLFTYSNEISTARWIGTAIGTTINNAVAPDGTTTATLLTATANADSRLRITTTQAVSTTHTLSIYAKAGSTNWLRLRNIGSNDCNGWFNVSTGVVGTVTGGTSSITSVGNGWYRCSITSTSGASIANNLVDIGAPSGDNTAAAAGGETIYVWGVQLEARSSATALTVTTTAPITNYIPALQTAASGVARFEHNPVTGESLGLEIEEQRTNICLRSEEFNDSGYVKSQSAITTNTAIAPDGTLTADLWTPTTSGSVQATRLLRTITVSNATAYTASVYVKSYGRRWVYFTSPDASAASHNCWFDLQNGVVGTKGASVTSATITSVGNGWYRLTTTATSTSTTNYIYISSPDADNSTTVTADSWFGLLLWGAQLEAGSFATSYIKTEGSQVTRSADSASMTGTNFSSWYRADEGTMYGEFQLANGNTATSHIAEVGDGGFNNRIFLIFASGSGNTFMVDTNGTRQVNIVSGAPTANTMSKLCGTYKVNDFAVDGSTGSIVTDTSGLVPVVNALQLGRQVAGGSTLNGVLSKFAFYPKRLTNAELQGLTTV